MGRVSLCIASQEHSSTFQADQSEIYGITLDHTLGGLHHPYSLHIGIALFLGSTIFHIFLILMLLLLLVHMFPKARLDVKKSTRGIIQ